ncbi:MAG: hypothetical protein MUC90_08680 [Thermoplasmata archaeon]|nr:hypothetical protein [Thermoplasmata archaeon]
MSHVLLLLAYKLKMFFGPSYRGRWGPLPLVGLMLVFVPSGMGMGFGVGAFLFDGDPETVVGTLGALLSAMLAMGFIFSLGVGITAHASELDFLMTAPLRSREYLVADMMFQFASVTVAGGLALLTAAIGLVVGIGAPLTTLIPLALLFGCYAVMIFFIVQIVTVVKIRHPKARAQTVAAILMTLSLLPALGVMGAESPLDLKGAPIPQAAFAELTYDALYGSSVAEYDLAVAAAYFVAVFVIWLVLSREYFFYGVRPTLSAGFGQVDFSSKMAQQKRMISMFGRSTSTISLNPLKGTDLSLMTRLGLIRVWRDGSFFFLSILAVIFLASGIMGARSGDSSSYAINTLQGASWPIAILALNWCYYERGNLWLPVVGGKSLMSYFRGLMTSFIILGLGVTAVMVFAMSAAGVPMKLSDMGFSIVTPIADAIVATALLTRIRVKPGAFSPGMLLVLLGTFIVGAAIGLGVSVVIGLFGSESSALVLLSVAFIALFSGGLMYIGFKAIDRLAKGFQFS